MDKKSNINRERKREGIILSAKELIIEKGYQKTNVEDITIKTGIAKGSFYTYFKSKDQLIMTILDEASKAMDERNRKVREREMSFRELLTYAVEEKFNLDEERAFRTLFLYHLTMNLESLNREITERLIEIRGLNITHWYEIIDRFNKELCLENSADKTRYAEYIEELVTLTLKNTIYHNKGEGGNFFISDIDTVLKKASEEKVKNEVNFLTKSLKNFF